MISENPNSQILEEFDISRPQLMEFGQTVFQLCNTLLLERKFKPHNITVRIKERESLEKKIERKSKYKSLNEITDLVGLRIITYFEDDINIVSEIIRKEFDIDEINSVDKREGETDRFGYRSVHYVFSISSQRLELTEYKRFARFKGEIQVRSILQHSWAEIEHDLGYKGVNEIPSSAKRTFYRTSALLEQADIEFVKLKHQVREFEKDQFLQIKNKKVTKETLESFLKSSSSLINLENEILQIKNLSKTGTSASFPENIISRISELKIATIDDLDGLFETNKQKILNLMENYYEKSTHKIGAPPKTLRTGSTLNWLIEILEEASSQTDLAIK